MTIRERCVHCGLTAGEHQDGTAAPLNACAVGASTVFTPAVTSPDRLRERVRDVKDKCCKDWALGNERINGPIVLEQLRSGRSVGEGHYIPWSFCPWCGASRLLPAGVSPQEPYSIVRQGEYSTGGPCWIAENHTYPGIVGYGDSPATAHGSFVAAATSYDALCRAPSSAGGGAEKVPICDLCGKEMRESIAQADEGFTYAMEKDGSFTPSKLMKELLELRAALPAGEDAGARPMAWAIACSDGRLNGMMGKDREREEKHCAILNEEGGKENNPNYPWRVVPLYASPSPSAHPGGTP